MSTISVDYDVLNQKGSPAWFSDTFANIPTAGYKGRMFISIDTYAFYRDTGTGWDLIGGPGIGTLTGSGATGQVSFFNGTQVLTGNNNLFWDNTNSRLGINTTTPGQPLDIHSTTNTLVQLNNTTTADSIIAFQNQNVTKWKIGNVYNANANSFDIYNVGTSSNALSFGSTTNVATFGGFIVAGTTSSNPSAVITAYSLTSSIQYKAAGSAPAITFSDTLTSSTYAGVFGLVTATNNFITGTAIGDMAIANQSNVAGAIVFGTGTTEYMRMTKVGTFSIGNTNSTFKLDVTGTSRITGELTLNSTISNGTYSYTLPSATGTLALTSNLSAYLPLAGGTLTGQLYINPTNTGITGLDVASNNTSFRSDNLEGTKRQLLITMGSGTLVQLTAKGFGANYGTDLAFYTATTGGVNASPGIYITGANNRVGIKTGSPAYDLDVAGTGNFSGNLTTNYIGASGNIELLNGNIFYLYNTGSSLYHWFKNNAGDLEIKFGASLTTMKITSTGLVGINTIDGSTQLSVKSNTTTSSTYPLFLFNSANTGVFHVRSDGYINTGTAANSPYNLTATGRSVIVDSGGGLGYLVSTRESKTNIESIKNIDFINQLNPVQFNYRKKDNDLNYTDELYNNITYGFIADEVEKVNKELAFYNEDGSLAGVEYNSMIAILTKAIQELNEKLVRNNIN